jgi:Zn-dependent M28 family amino/carboxypeptidase
MNSPPDISEIGSRARRIVEILAREHPSRSGLFPDRLESAARFIEAEMRTLGYSVESQTYESDGTNVRNLIAERPGRNPAASCIVLGAHYDTVPETPGADDNASGAAGLLELARLLRDYPTRRPIKFVAFAHEEPPYFYTVQMGSRQYAKMLRRQKAKVLLMFSLEMLGYADECYEQSYPFPLMRQLLGYPKSGNFVGLVGNVRTIRLLRVVREAMRRGCNIGVESLSAPGFLPPLFLSDHSSFWRYRYPALMVTDTAFMRNPHYHLPTDTDSTINYRFLAEVISGVYSAVLALDGLP